MYGIKSCLTTAESLARAACLWNTMASLCAVDKISTVAPDPARGNARGAQRPVLVLYKVDCVAQYLGTRFESPKYSTLDAINGPDQYVQAIKHVLVHPKTAALKGEVNKTTRGHQPQARCNSSVLLQGLPWRIVPAPQRSSRVCMGPSGPLGYLPGALVAGEMDDVAVHGC